MAFRCSASSSSRQAASLLRSASSASASTPASSSATGLASRSLRRIGPGEASYSASATAAAPSAQFSTSSFSAALRPTRPLAAQSRVDASSSSSSSSPSSPSSFAEDNPALTPQQTTEEMQQWFRAAYPAAVQLPDNVLVQAITHESWDHGMGRGGHNRRLAFLGRRAMYMFLAVFLHSRIAAVRNPSTSRDSSSSSSTSASSTLLSSTESLEKLLHTSRLGDEVGRTLKLEEVMRWRPAISEGQRGPKETGLFKVRGVAVEALIGAIYHQHGASAARAFFHSKILTKMESLGDKARQELKEAIDQEARAGETLLAQMAEAPAGNVSSIETSGSDGSSASVSDAVAQGVRPTFEGYASRQQPVRRSTAAHASSSSGGGGAAAEEGAVEDRSRAAAFA